jgi:ribose transport system substrate-binding protein
MAAQVATKLLKGKGNVVVFTIPGQANMVERLRGYSDVFATNQIKIVETVDMKGDPAVAFDRTTAILDSGKPAVDAFVCLEALACAEVAEVINRKQVTGKLVIAMDTDELTLEGIRKGTISATVAQKPFTMAFTAVKMLDDIHHHKPASLDRRWALDPFSPIPAFVDTGATLIDKSNVEEFIREHQAATAPAKK